MCFSHFWFELLCDLNGIRRVSPQHTGLLTAGGGKSLLRFDKRPHLNFGTHLQNSCTENKGQKRRRDKQKTTSVSVACSRQISHEEITLMVSEVAVSLAQT